ncbi:MAG: hypothetical protein H6643_13225 [Caldilineaceae bacterium]|nr:hypothetical protein [Caldilineaceae bacterium]
MFISDRNLVEQAEALILKHDLASHDRQPLKKQKPPDRHLVRRFFMSATSSLFLPGPEWSTPSGRWPDLAFQQQRHQALSPAAR